MLQPALARPQQLFAYGGAEVDHAGLAAAYAFGIARNPPFVEGNKRTAAVACELFLQLNGCVLLADDAAMFLGLAEGSVDDAELTGWLRANMRPMQVSDAGTGYARTRLEG